MPFNILGKFIIEIVSVFKEILFFNLSNLKLFYQNLNPIVIGSSTSVKYRLFGLSFVFYVKWLVSQCKMFS